MIVDDLHVVGVAVAPTKADPPSVVDPHAVLAFSIAAQCLKAVAGRHAQVVELPCPVQIEQLAAGGSLKGTKPAYSAIMEQLLRVFRCKRPDHEGTILRVT